MAFPALTRASSGVFTNMSEDDRLTKIKDLLDSTVQQFESVFESAGDFDHSKVGNGWTPSAIPSQTYLIKGITVGEATRIAESRKARMFGPLGFLRFRASRTERIGQPELVYFPYWRAKAYHECFYFRGKAYRATVPDDVIAVQIGSRIMPLVAEISTRGSFLRKIAARIKGLLFARSTPRYIPVDNATELAYQFRETTLLVDGEGRSDSEMEYILEKKPQMRRMEKNEVLKDENAPVKFAPLTLGVDGIAGLLHAKVVKPPVVFNKILTNRFEVSELQLLELPVYVFRYKYLGREKELRIHGVTGESLK